MTFAGVDDIAPYSKANCRNQAAQFYFREPATDKLLLSAPLSIAIALSVGASSSIS
jgi:hypothetical protein